MDFRLLSFFLSNLHLQMCTNFMIIFSASAQPITKKLVKENIHDVSTTGDSIRQRFLDFYAARGHKILPSASLVPDDPTVLLTIAGMLQFKPIFLGQVVSYPLRYWGRVEWKESEWQCYSNWYGLQNNDKNCSRKSLSSEVGMKIFLSISRITCWEHLSCLNRHINTISWTALLLTCRYSIQLFTLQSFHRDLFMQYFCCIFLLPVNSNYEPVI